MKLALDTNRYTDLARGDPSASGVVADAAEVILPFITLAELRLGFAASRDGKSNERHLRLFLDQAHVTSLFPDDRTTQRYPELHWYLRRAGTPIPPHDIWIAALVLQHDLVLYTRDRHFQFLPQVPLL